MPWLLLLLLGGGAYFVWKKREGSGSSLPMGPVAPPSQLPPNLPPNMGTKMDVPQPQAPMEEAEPDFIVAYDSTVFDQPSFISSGPPEPGAVLPAFIRAGTYLWQAQTVDPVPGWIPVSYPYPYSIGWIQEQHVRSARLASTRAFGASMFSPF